MFTRKRRAIVRPLSIYLASTLALVGGSWLADGLIPLFSGQPWLPWLTLGGVLCFTLGFIWLWHLRRDLLGVQTLYEHPSPRPHRVLIATVSPSNLENWRFDDKGLPLKEGRSLADTNTLKDFVDALDEEKLDEEKKKKKWNALPLLRGILAHEKSLKVLYLLSSKKDDADREKTEWKKLFDRYLPKVTVEWKDIVDSESLEEYLEAIEKICRECREQGIGYRDIIIDITGGKKISSVGAASATLKYPGLEFQYVSTDNTHTIRTYNVQTVTPDPSVA